MKNKFPYLFFLILIYSYAYFSFFSDFIFAGLQLYKSFFYFILDIIFLIIGLIVIKDKKDKIYFTVFIFLTLLSQIYNSYSNSILYLNGLREFIPLFCAPLIIKKTIIDNRFRFIRAFNSFLKIFLFFQIPVSIAQYLKYGPGDMVSGTMGNGSGTLTILIYLITFYLFRQENIKFIKRDIFKLIFIFSCWIPTFINETKISFILIPAFFLFQVTLRKNQIIRSLSFVIVFLPLLLFTLKTYYNKNERMNTGLFDKEYLSFYLYGDSETTEYYDIPRFLKLELGVRLLSQDVINLFIGKGLGHFKGGTTLEKTDFSSKNEELMQGTITFIFFSLMQLGILGVILLLIQIFKDFISELFKHGYKRDFFFYSVITLIAIFYGTTFRWPFFCIVYFFIIYSTIFVKQRYRFLKEVIKKSHIELKRNHESKQIQFT